MAKQKVRVKKRRDILREIAAECAADLFVEYKGRKATRLVLEMPGQTIGGSGWCEQGVVDRILKTMKKRLEVTD